VGISTFLHIPKILISVDKTIQVMKHWEELNIARATYYKYLKQGMPKDTQQATDWIAQRHGLMTSGSNEIIISGKKYDATDLIDLRGQVMEAQVEHLNLKNKIKKFELSLKSGELVQSSELADTLKKILIPLKKSLDNFPSKIAKMITPEDPTAEQRIDDELQKIFQDLQKQINGQSEKSSI